MKKVLLIILIGLISSSFFKVMAQPLSGYIISKQNIYCNNSNFGSVKVSGFGGIAPYWFELDGSGSFLPGDLDYNGDLILDRAFQNLTGGSHIIVVKDDVGDNFLIEFLISIDEFIIGIINVTNMECEGFNDGEITAGVVTGGNTPIQWSIDGGTNWQATGLFANLINGPYTVTARDNLGCLTTYDTIVDLNDVSMIEVLVNNDVNCFGEANGSVEIIAVNGTAPYQYSLDAIIWQNSGVFSGFTAGTYTFYSIGFNGCVSDTTFEISQPDELLINNFNVTNNTCYGDSLGSINFGIAGGTPGYVYDLNGTLVSLPIDELAGGSYQLIVIDTNGCDVSYDFIISDPDQIDIIIDNATNISCYNAGDGSITVSASGGNGVIQYSIDGGLMQGAGFFSGLGPGNHTILVEDEDGCQTSMIIPLSQPNNINATKVVIHPDCEFTANGSIDLINPIGGNGGPYSYTYSFNGGIFQPTVLPLINLIPGNYKIRVYDVSGVCFRVKNTNLISSSDLSIDSLDIIDALCGMTDGEVTVNVSGGQPPYIFDLGGIIQAGNPVFSNIPVGNYPVVVTDFLGCSVSTTVNVEEYSDMVITLENVINEYCDNVDGEIEITVAGGTSDYQFIISGDPTTYGPDPNGWTFSGLLAGDYTITVIDLSGCTQTLEVTIEDTPTFYYEINPVSCNGMGDGEITVWASTDPIDPPSATAPYTFEISSNPGVPEGPANLWTFNLLPAGVYSILLTDVNGCQQTISDIEIIEPDPISLLAYPNDTIQLRCFGDMTLDSTLFTYNTLTISGFGGTPGYEYSVNGGPFVPGNTGSKLHQLIGYPAGSINIDVKDNNGCILSTEVIVEEPQFPLDTGFINVTHNSCIGDSIGVIEVNAIGGWGGYQYQLDGLTLWQVSNTFTELAPGSYTVNIIDSLNCQVSYMVDVLVSDPLEAISTLLNHPNCDLASNGSVQIEITQGWGVSPTNLLIDGIAAPDVPINTNPYVVNNLTSGAHTFILTNGACSISILDTLNNINDLELIFNSETPIECPLDSNGVIDFSVSGGVPPFIFEIDGVPFAGPPTATNLDLGMHSITVTDIVGCTQTLNAEVTTLSTLEGFASAVDALCLDDFSKGSVTIFASQGVSPFLIWEESDPVNVYSGTQHEFLDLPIGDYNFWISDAIGCEIIVPVSISELSGIDFDLSIIQDPVCHGDSNAIVSINVAVGVQPFQYSLDDINFIPFPENSTIASLLLQEGNQSIYVEAGNGCKTLDSILIIEPDSLDASIDYQAPITCFGDSIAVIEINPTGGMLGYEFSFNGSNFVTDSIFVDLSSGDYLYKVSDANGCIFGDSAWIGQPDMLYFDTLQVTENNCYGIGDSTGSINIVGMGGTLPYSYSIDGGIPDVSGFFENLIAGDHLVSIIDNYGCTFDSLIHITAPDSLFIDSINISNILCYGDSTGIVEFTATGGTPDYIFQLTGLESNSTGIFPNVPVGDYFINVVDANGCEFQESILITEPPELVLSITDIQNLTCFNDSSGQVQINAVGGVTPYMFGQSIDELNVSGLFTDLSADTSWFYTIDANLCIDSILIEITQPDSLWISVDINQPIDCFGSETGEFEISGMGGTSGYLYAINGSEFSSDSIVSNAIAGQYIIQIQDNHQCEFTDTLILDQPELINFNAVVTPLDCYNNESGIVELYVDGGTPEYLYSIDSLNWYTESVFDGFTAGYHSIYIIDNNDCVVDSVVYISEPDSISTIYAELNQVTCAGFSNAKVQFDVSGGAPPYIGVFNNDTLQGPVFILDNLSTGDYQISIYDGNECLNENEFTLFEPDTLEAEIEAIELLCYGDQNGVGIVTAIGGSGSYNYEWNNITDDTTNTTQANLQANITYVVTVFDIVDSNCFVTAEVIPDQPAQIEFVLTPLSLSCDINDRGVLIELASGGVDPFLYLMGSEDISEAVPDPYFSNLSDALTSFSVIDANGCDEEKFITPFNPNIPNASFVADNAILSFLDPLLNLNDKSYNHNYISWSFGDGIVLSGSLDESFDEQYTWGPVVSPTHEYQMPGNYKIQIIVNSSFGCTDSSSGQVYIQSEDLVYIPNAFTPDEDGKNDLFNIKGSGLQSEGFSMQVYNRGGRLVYQTVNLHQGWDGNDLKGTNAPPEMYIYVIRVYSGDRLIEKNGSVLLIR